ncbi:AAA family ATPase [Flammeovirga sp. SJP92]|uniref:AAA family ATPase n=1 Tax=Flammeovirga sp. SJP92 TaxID=1775430 RepID=UPI00078991B7|nr:AAA family ATPase [Flammeovirga sp. SJP92]KXX72736.1 hypothetical protein AVL50_32060 [Flammeovirga sp. SJP92]
MDNNLIIANRVQNLRKNIGLTQIELAEKAGVSIGSIQRIESGKSSTIDLLGLVAKALSVTIDYLLQNCIVIAVTNTKGGSGKSTIASHLARVLYDMTSKKILVYDTDVQKSIYKPYQQSDVENIPVDCIAFDHTKRFVSKDSMIRTDVDQFKYKYEIIIIDSPGNFDSFSFISEIISSSDFAIVPFQLSRMGIEGTEFIDRLLEETNESRAKQGKPVTRAFAVATMVNRVTHEFKMLQEIEFDAMEILSSSISNSVEYTRTDTLDTKSDIKEFRKFVKEFITKANI